MMKDVDCPRCNTALSWGNISPCLCTVTADFCENCAQFVLENYSCPVCAPILPARGKYEIDAANYVKIIKVATIKKGKL